MCNVENLFLLAIKKNGLDIERKRFGVSRKDRPEAFDGH